MSSLCWSYTRFIEPESSSSVVEKKMEDVKNAAGPQEMDNVGSAEEAPIVAEPMDTERGNTGSLSESNPLAVGPPSPLTGCYLLIIVGEPHSEEAKRVIIEQLKQGKQFMQDQS